ncbi:hypothetical protein E4U19_000156 [Claviceps sp. Clav32 group G5]|nr:hypothetical protein E4U19_000156 [Claviceps sp. Clav32 group G5]
MQPVRLRQLGLGAPATELGGRSVEQRPYWGRSLVGSGGVDGRRRMQGALRPVELLDGLMEFLQLGGFNMAMMDVFSQLFQSTVDTELLNFLAQLGISHMVTVMESVEQLPHS